MSFLILTLTLTFLNAFAQDEHASEIHEGEAEKSTTHSEEEHSSHEEKQEHAHVREVEGPHVHNSLTAETAQWVGVATLIASVPVFAVKAKSANKLVFRNAILTLSVGVGIVHILLTPDHLVDVNVSHAIFFAVLGVAQIGYGLLFMIRPMRNLAIIGAAGNIGSIILYFVTRIENIPEPFGAPEGVDAIGIIAKIAEISLVALLIYLTVHLRKSIVEAKG